MSQPLQGPCQSKTGAFVQSKTGSAVTCRDGVVYIMFLIDESSTYHVFNVQETWDAWNALYLTARTRFETIGLELVIRVVHIPSDIGPTGLNIFHPIRPGLDPDVDFPWPTPIEEIQTALRLPTVDELLQSIAGSATPIYARLIHDNSGSVSLVNDEPLGIAEVWAAFLVAARNKLGWSAQSLAHFDTRSAGQDENVLRVFATALDEAFLALQ